MRSPAKPPAIAPAMRSTGRYFCSCGEHFTKIRALSIHIAIHNPHWPRTAAGDLHRQIEEYEWKRRSPGEARPGEAKPKPLRSP